MKRVALDVGVLVGCVALAIVVGVVTMGNGAQGQVGIPDAYVPPTVPQDAEWVPQAVCPYGCEDLTGHYSCAECRQTVCPYHEHVCDFALIDCPCCGGPIAGHEHCRGCATGYVCPQQQYDCGQHLCPACQQKHMAAVPHGICPTHGLRCGYVTGAWIWPVWHCDLCDYRVAVTRPQVGGSDE